MQKLKRDQEQQRSVWRAGTNRRCGRFFLLSLVFCGLLLSWQPFVGAQPAPRQKSDSITDEDPFRLPALEREINPREEEPGEQPRTPAIREQDLPDEDLTAPAPSGEKEPVRETGEQKPTVDQTPETQPTEERTAPSETEEKEAPTATTQEEPPAEESPQSPLPQERLPAVVEERQPTEPSATEPAQEKAAPAPAKGLPS